MSVFPLQSSSFAFSAYLEVKPIGINDLLADPWPDRRPEGPFKLAEDLFFFPGDQFPRNPISGKLVPSATLSGPSGPSIWQWIGLEAVFPYRIDFKIRSWLGYGPLRGSEGSSNWEAYT